MRIHDDHLYHGAALIQIAEHPQFTAINSFKLRGEPNRSAYKINDHIGVYLKYCANPSKVYNEYAFTFNNHHLEALASMGTLVNKVVLVMVCVKAREVCCISYDELISMVDGRVKAKGGREEQYIVKVTALGGNSMRAYMDYPGKKKTMLGKAIVVPRNRFPGQLFE
jgi:hypothetical protein